MGNSCHEVLDTEVDYIDRPLLVHSKRFAWGPAETLEADYTITSIYKATCFTGCRVGLVTAPLRPFQLDAQIPLEKAGAWS